MKPIPGWVLAYAFYVAPVLLVLSVPNLLRAEEWAWSQRLHILAEGFGYSTDNQDRKRAEGFGKLRYEASAQKAPLFAKLNARLVGDSANFTQAFADEPNNNTRRTYFNLDEAFIGVKLGPEEYLALRGGKQVYNWSVTDELHPLNVFVPTDFSDPLRKDDMGLLSLSAKYIFGDKSFLEALMVPGVFTPSRLGQRQWDPFRSLPRRRHLPASGTPSLSVGMRYQGNVGDVTFSVVGFQGRDSIPELRSDKRLLAAGESGIVDTYPQTSMAGINLTYPWGEFVFKGEAAFFFHPKSDDYAHWILGADYRQGDLFVILQYFHEDLLRRSGGSFIDRGFRRIFKDLIFGRVEYALPGDWTVTIKGGYDWRKDEFVAQPKISYRINDNSKLSLSHEVIGGVKDSYFGAVKKNKRTALSVEFFL